MTHNANAQSLVTQPPSGALRFLLRLPILLYRWHLGWLLGSRFVMIDHVGRKSGKHYQTVVEVVEHDRASDTYTVASGWGDKASWFQNLMAQPQTTIHSGGRTLHVRAEWLPAPEAAQCLLEYRQHHRLSARELSRIMGKDIFQATPQELEQLTADSLPIIAFRKQSAP